MNESCHIFVNSFCTGGRGFGSYSCLIYKNDETVELSSGNTNTTANYMIIQGIITALETTRNDSVIEIIHGSKYVANALTKNTIDNRIERNWYSSTGKDIPNKELWKRLIELLKTKENVSFTLIEDYKNDSNLQYCYERARSFASHIRLTSEESTSSNSKEALYKNFKYLQSEMNRVVNLLIAM